MLKVDHTQLRKERMAALKEMDRKQQLYVEFLLRAVAAEGIRQSRIAADSGSLEEYCRALQGIARASGRHGAPWRGFRFHRAKKKGRSSRSSLRGAWNSSIPQPELALPGAWPNLRPGVRLLTAQEPPSVLQIHVQADLEL